MNYGSECTGDLCLASVGPLNCNKNDCNKWSEEKDYSCDVKNGDGSLLLEVNKENFDGHIEMRVKADGDEYYSNPFPVYISTPIGWDFNCLNPTDVKCTEIANTVFCNYLHSSGTYIIGNF